MLNLLGFSKEKLAEYIKQNNTKIIVYGAGMIGKIIVPYYLVSHNLLDNIDCYVDSDKKKQGNHETINRKIIKICPVEKLDDVEDNTIILITNSNFSSVIPFLDSIPNLDKKDAAIIPVMQEVEVRNASVSERKVVEDYSSECIPKVINYCWFSGSPLPDYLKKCIESWHKICPDYEIKRWDESNYDVSKNPYMKQAYEAKKWGFVPDYARLDILYNHGGFYLDTDVELIKSLDELRNQGAFCGVEKWGNINMGGCSGAVPHHPMIKRILDSRESIPFKYDDGTLNLNTCGVYETAPFIELGMRVDNTTQRINDMTVFSSDYFHPYDYMSGETIITKNTYSIHHFNGGWLDKKSRDSRRKTMEEYKKLLHRMGYDYGEIQNISNNSGL